jgi:lactate dehydrogenase-like 2-hydroxyacid dehydrogenase
VANFGVGVNNIDLEAARAAGVAVSNTPGVLTDATADIAVALMLAATRRMSETEAILRSGGWDGWRPTGWLGMGLQGKVLGIVGMGRIGAAVARRSALGFGMRVVYFNRSEVGPFDFGAEARPSVEAVLAEADVVSLHVPGGGGNSRLISAERIRGMKRGAYLVNTARGDVVDEDALAEALESGRLAGAGLDVFAEEPRVPERLVRLRNVTLLPHIGSATLETRTAMGMLAVDNLEAFFAGRPMPARVA